MTHTEILTISNPGADDQQVALYSNGSTIAVEVTDSDESCIELKLTDSELESLIAKAAVVLAMRRLAK